MRQRVRKRPSPGIGLKHLSCSLAALLSLGALAEAQSNRGGNEASQNNVQAVSDYDVVACRLPGVVMRIGRHAMRESRGKLVRVTARTCEIRGGRYVYSDRASVSGSLQAWLPEATAGDPEAQTYVAELYERGLSGEPDYEMSRIWYERAAEQDYGPALFNLARFYDEGLGVPRDARKSGELYRQAMGISESLAGAVDLVDPDELRILRASLEERDAMIAQQRTVIAGLEAEIEQLERERDAALERVGALEASLSSARADLATKLDGQADTVRAVETQMASIESERQSLQARERQLVADQAELARQQAALTDALAARQGAEAAALHDLEAALDAARIEMTRLSAERDRAVQAEASAIRALSSSDDRLSTRLAELAERERDIAQRENEIAALTERYGHQSVALAAEREDIEAERARLAAERVDLENRAASYTRQLGELNAARTDLEAIDAELSAERARLVAWSNQLQQMSAAQNDLSAERAALVQREAAVSAEAAQVSAMRRDLDHKLQAISHLETQLARAQSDASRHVETIRVNEAEIARLQRELDAAEVRAQESDARLEDAHALMAQVYDLTNRGTAGSASIAPSSSAPQLPNVDFGDYHAILIGNENYVHPDWPDLVTPHEDVDRMSALLEDRYDFSTHVLKDADLLTMADEIFRIAIEEVGPDDNLLIYFAGHGQYFPDAQRFFWEPVSSTPTHFHTSLGSEFLHQVMVESRARKILIVADSCYAGFLTRSPRAILTSGATQEQADSYWQGQANSRSRTVLASGGLQPVADGGGGEHSLFAEALISVLETNVGILPADELHHEVYERVVGRAVALQHDQEPEYREITTGTHEGGDFIFVPLPR
ncbi:MAG: caspase family protein [Pseudomonadota bacterium]